MQALLSLGMFVFSLPTLAHEDLQRRSDWRHARSARIGTRDATQFVGPGDDAITIAGSAIAELQDSRASLDTLRDMAAGGEAWPLVDGAGRVYGSYVITGLDERHKHLLPTGEARRIDFTIDLLSVDDPSASVARR